jgi:hypothetical protein
MKRGKNGTFSCRCDIVDTSSVIHTVGYRWFISRERIIRSYKYHTPESLGTGGLTSVSALSSELLPLDFKPSHAHDELSMVAGNIPIELRRELARV